MTNRKLQTPSGEWKLVWGDEFDYNGLPNPKKWAYEEGLIRNQELQFYTKRRENARVENGMLVIEGRKESYQGSAYTSASLNTLGKFTFQYGRIEVRAKLPDGLGTWPAIWMMGEDINVIGWPRCAEIDIMEHVAHDPGVVHATLHQINNEKKHWTKNGTTAVPDFAKEFHVYVCEWHPERLDFFVDDKKFFTYPYDGPGTWTFDRRCYLLINLAIGGAWGGQKGVDEKAFPQKYLIDYVRIYQTPKMMGK
jgi:beta-glucanase (GH16 family)